MPLPMVHLGIAREYAQDFPLLMSCPEFYLGSISPDAIHIRKNTAREDKNVTHLRLKEDLWLDNVLEFLKKSRDKSDFSFLLGYGIHILTDIIWLETLYKDFQTLYKKDLTPIQEMMWAYYNDTDQLDFELYKICEWRQEVWELLEEAKCGYVDGILSADEIEDWKHRVLHWFNCGESEHKNPIKYISVEDILQFTKDTGNRIKEILELEGLCS